MAYVLSDAEVTDHLGGLDGWGGDATGISREITFETFPDGIEAVRRVAAIAEAANHHPDIDIRWRTVTFALTTHSAGGVTSADIDMARGINDVVAG